jgi:RNA polymerase sigma-70 factor, ECF subfamily
MYKNIQFEKIYGSEVDAIFRFCLVRVSNREQALDITQETFLRLWQSLMAGKEILNNKAFLFTISHRLIIDWYRKKKSLSLESLLSKDKENDTTLVDEKTSGPGIELGAEGRFLLDKVNDLDPTYRDSVYLRFAEGMSPREIGEILGISPNAASVRVNRGLIELRKNTGYDREGGYRPTLRPSLS